MQEKSRILIRSGASFAEALATARHTTDITQASMAERLHCSRDTITNLESGRSRQLDRLARFVRFCGYDIVLVPRSQPTSSQPANDTFEPVEPGGTS